MNQVMTRRSHAPLQILLFLLICPALLPLTGEPGWADEGPALNPTHKAKILMAGLSLSRGLPNATGSQVSVMLGGECETADALATFEGKKLNGATVEFKRVNDADILKKLTEGGTPAVLFYCSESKKRLKDIAALAAKLKVVTISDDVDDLKNGLMFGVEVRGERAGLVLNMPQAKAIGLEFDPRFYVVTRVIQ